MRYLITILLALSPCIASAQKEKGTTLHDPKTGATVTLPEGWSFATDETGLVGKNEENTAFVLVAGAKENFAQVIEDVRALVLLALDDVEVERSGVVSVDERGGFEGLVAVTGTGVSRKDGKPVEFNALVVKTGEAGALVLGAWKNAEQAAVVTKVLQSLRVEKTAGKGGLVLTNAAVGASVQVPEGWNVVASRKGLMAADPQRGAMTLIMGGKEDFDASVEKVKKALTTWVFKDVSISDFAVAEASYDKSLGTVVAATGKAVDRMDGEPVEFSALRIDSKDADRGLLVFGAWKDDEHEQMVTQMLSSLKVDPAKAEKTKKEK